MRCRGMFYQLMTVWSCCSVPSLDHSSHLCSEISSDGHLRLDVPEHMLHIPEGSDSVRTVGVCLQFDILHDLL